MGWRGARGDNFYKKKLNPPTCCSGAERDDQGKKVRTLRCKSLIEVRIYPGGCEEVVTILQSVFVKIDHFQPPVCKFVCTKKICEKLWNLVRQFSCNNLFLCGLGQLFSPGPLMFLS